MIKNDLFFSVNDLSQHIEGNWKTIGRWGRVKINGDMDNAKNVHIVVISQTFWEHVLSAVISIITLGCIKDRFKSEQTISQKNFADFHKVKNTVMKCYCDIILEKHQAPSKEVVEQILFNESKPLLTERQLLVIKKLTKVTSEIVNDLIMTLMSARDMTVQEFAKAVHQVALPDVGERTRRFLTKMTAAINEDISKVLPLSSMIDRLSLDIEDKGFRESLVNVIALPKIRSLIEELDSVAESIVDDIIV
ncbi:MAG: hypothetical protein WCG42_05210 [Parachlamydiaceae bacterium]